MVFNTNISSLTSVQQCLYSLADGAGLLELQSPLCPPHVAYALMHLASFYMLTAKHWSGPQSEWGVKTLNDIKAAVPAHDKCTAA